jgi:DNA polymerase (family 10)
LVKNTPPGVIEMLKIKGIGPKKIHTIWKEMEIETIGELLYACEENRLKLYKGFGEKTQQQVKDTLQYYLQNKDLHLYAQVELAAENFETFLQKIFPGKKVFITGDFKQQNPIINTLDFLIEGNKNELLNELENIIEWKVLEHNDNEILVDSNNGIHLKIIPSNGKNIIELLIKTSSSAGFYNQLEPYLKKINETNFDSEEDVFKNCALPYIPAILREDINKIEELPAEIPSLIKTSDIKGIIHSHSNWSDGGNTVEDMAIVAQNLGMEYLVMSDHSKSAFYAQGLTVERIKAQHEYIDELNVKLAPFKIFKSIESDILNNGSLDYDDNVLASFDLVIASVHSNLKMTEEKAMERLLIAINNPYTTILGHPTGRLLLSRKGYPLRFEEIIEACAKHQVVIEINANPRRLDLDWEYIRMATAKNVLLSINPDAHSLEGMKDIRYGVLAAQKGMLTAKNNLSSYSLAEFETFLKSNKTKA